MESHICQDPADMGHPGFHYAEEVSTEAVVRNAGSLLGQARSVHQHGDLSLNQFQHRRVAKSLFGTVSLLGLRGQLGHRGL